MQHLKYVLVIHTFLKLEKGSLKDFKATIYFRHPKYFPGGSHQPLSLTFLDRGLGNELGQATRFMMGENQAQIGPIATSHIFSPFRTQQTSN